MVRMERLLDCQCRFLRGSCRRTSGLILSHSLASGMTWYETVTGRAEVEVEAIPLIPVSFYGYISKQCKSRLVGW